MPPEITLCINYVSFSSKIYKLYPFLYNQPMYEKKENQHTPKNPAS